MINIIKQILKKIPQGLILLFHVVFLCSCNQESSTKEAYKDGDLASTFIDSSGISSDEYTTYLDSLVQSGWKLESVPNGQLPSCFNFVSTFDSSLGNYLKINVGGNTNVVVKLMEMKTKVCIRYVYVNSKSSYSIANIPEGLYFLKIAYGWDWISNLKNQMCIGKFLKKSLYSIGNDTLDFRVKRNSEGISIPSFELSLDVIESGFENSFDSKKITEREFNE